MMEKAGHEITTISVGVWMAKRGGNKFIETKEGVNNIAKHIMGTSIILQKVKRLPR